jgi:hypothetical protein
MGTRFPVITQAWLNAWEYVTPFLAYPAEVRRVIYTTDESVKAGARSHPKWFVRACGGARAREGVARRHGCRRMRPDGVCGWTQARGVLAAFAARNGQLGVVRLSG